jgi:putative transposase
MKKSRFSERQIIAILKQAEAGTPPERCREHGMSSALFYRWRSKYSGIDASMMARMKAPEEENRRLKKMYAEQRLKAEIIAEALQKNGSAISAAGDGAMDRCTTGGHDQFGLSGVWHQPNLLPVASQTERRKRHHC